MSATMYIVMNRSTLRGLSRGNDEDGGYNVIHETSLFTTYDVIEAIVAGKIKMFTEEDVKRGLVDNFGMNPKDLVLAPIKIEYGHGAPFISHPQDKPKE